MLKSEDTRIEIIECKCGCGETLNKYDGHYRTREYVSGHNRRKYDDPKEHKKIWYEKTKEDRKEIRTEGKKKRRTQKKFQLLELRGGKCVGCEVKATTENQYMFDFHHVDPSTKRFSVTAASTQNKSWDKVLKEAEKCVVLCANCHRLHHNTDLVPIDKDILNEDKRT